MTNKLIIMRSMFLANLDILQKLNTNSEYNLILLTLSVNKKPK